MKKRSTFALLLITISLFISSLHLNLEETENTFSSFESKTSTTGMFSLVSIFNSHAHHSDSSQTETSGGHHSHHQNGCHFFILTQLISIGDLLIKNSLVNNNDHFHEIPFLEVPTKPPIAIS
ncbi:MAG: hypothetical protein B7Y39_04335 [Bdellovibrio sp. 28-41-41]|nr:MAG: hypothetical protein B7Y39_04335 [Bdellovibrio sp. 28-41-41]